MKITICQLLFVFLSLHIFAQDGTLQELLDNDVAVFQKIKENPDKFQVQIIYTQIDRDENNQPSFTDFTYNVDANRYFYPASTVKMPTAFMALEKLNELRIIGLDRDSKMQTEAGSSPQTEAKRDSTSQSTFPSVAHYIKKIFLVSDNDAFNRLYEFVGQEYLNQKLQEKGFTDTRIIHRLAISGFDSDKNKYTNPVSFYNTADSLVYHQGEVFSAFEPKFSLHEEIRGLAKMTNTGEIVEEPFDFREKNFISLKNLHQMLQSVIFPDATPEHQRFNLKAGDYAFLYKCMSQFPQESTFPNYKKGDNYVKFWMYGDADENAAIPKHIRIFNKVGLAYGFLSDVAYIIDTKNKIEFLVSACIHVNENETYNDGVYEYDTIGFPFFGELGRAIYHYELERDKKFTPDLSRFEYEYKQ